jgi:hypothetical protein
MSRFTRIFDMLDIIFGKGFMSKNIGKRTNVITLPDENSRRLLTKELAIDKAPDSAIQQGKKDLEKLALDIPKLNDQELLTLTNNAERLAARINPKEFIKRRQRALPKADVIEFANKEKISPEGVMSLTEKIGQKNAPGTLMGNLESRIKQLEASGEDLSKMKGQTYDEFMNDITQGQRTMIRLEDEGLVRATAREIIDKDIKSKKIKLPKEVEADFKQGGGEPIDVFRQFYGEDALEQLNSMVPDFRQMYSPREAAEAATKKFNFEFKADRPPGSISIEDARKAEQEFNIIPADSEEGKVITEKLIGKPKASVTELVTAEKIISDMKKMDPMDAMKEANKVLKKEGKYKNLQEKDVERIMEDTNDFIFGRDIPEDPEGFAVGGRVEMAAGGITKLVKKAMEFFSDNDPVSAYKKYLKYVKETAQKDPAKLAPEMGGIVVGSELIHRGLRRKLKEAKEKNDTDDSEDTTTEDRTEKAAGGVSQGLDYLTGIERRGYANGDYAVQAGIKNYLGKQKTATVPIKWKSGKDHPDTELAYITKPEKDLLLKLDMHNSMPDGEPNIGPGGIISLNSGGSGDVGPDSAGPSDTGGELSYTDYSDADIGPMGLSAQGVVSPENYNLVDEATAKANLQSVVDNMRAKMTKDMDPLQRSAFNLSINNPFTSTFGKIGNSVLSPIGTILSSFSYNPDFAGDRKYTDYGNTQSDEYGSEGDGSEGDGSEGDGRKFIPSFDTTLLTPDLDKNRDYRLFQSSNNPFYSLQRNPSGGISNVYTEFKKGEIKPLIDEGPKTPIGLFPNRGGGQTTPLIDEGPKTPIGLFPGGGGGQTTPLTATSSLIEDFYKSSFSQKPTMGTQALVPITLPTGETYTLRSGGEASNFRDFLGSLNMAPETVDNIFEKRPETSPQLNIPLIDKGGRVGFKKGGVVSKGLNYLTGN